MITVGLRPFLVGEMLSVPILNALAMLMIIIYFDDVWSLAILLASCMLSSHIYAEKMLITTGVVSSMSCFYLIAIVPLFLCAVFYMILFHTLRKTIDELQLRYDDIDQTSRAKSIFLSSIGHEVRVPLHAILGSADLMLMQSNTCSNGSDGSGKLNKKQQEHMETIVNCGTCLLDTMNAVLNYAKLEASTFNERTRQQMIMKSVFSFKQLMHDTIQMFKSTAQSKHISLVLKFQMSNSGNAIDKVYTDKINLRTVFNNLLSNACKFTEPVKGMISVIVSDSIATTTTVSDENGGRLMKLLQEQQEDHYNQQQQLKRSQSSSKLLHVETSASNLHHRTSSSASTAATATPSSSPLPSSSSTASTFISKLYISILDNGKGMSKEFLPNVFKPFSQQDCTTQREYGGTGLGLAIVKQIIDLLGGTITLESQVNTGTLFTIELPLEPLPAQSSVAVAASTSTTMASGLTRNAKSFESLCTLGNSVSSATIAQQASSLSASTPRLVVM